MPNPMTKEEFSNIKTLLASGFSIMKTCEIIKRSEPVVRKAEKCANWDEYCGVKPEAPKEPKPPVMLSNQYETILSRIDKTNELLEQIIEIMKKYMEV